MASLWTSPPTVRSTQASGSLLVVVSYGIRDPAWSSLCISVAVAGVSLSMVSRESISLSDEDAMGLKIPPSSKRASSLAARKFSSGSLASDPEMLPAQCWTVSAMIGPAHM
ncbi:hypothetical protein NDU88_001816 [Pleurodeles waltl]|uniref:Uncharacterized protein n=1 Tax=Pleurodeles waltl TaxID=8319 RepID=A0AAV7TIW3_PLEWA|nr:hypothetical protein NDU88_001816 [Pleurodeles waltl]